jgi:polysaccharide chain length determinant protein (PEP-CTERM system associated)
MTADQVAAALWRRKGLIAAITVVLSAVGAAMVVGWPNVYKSTVVVRVEPLRPHAEMVQKTVDDDIANRLFTVRQQLMGRPVLQKAIEEMNLYPEIVSKNGMDAAVEKMRQDLDVRVEGEYAFELSYSANDPQTAAKVANRLPELFGDQETKLRTDQATRATQLFSTEVDALKNTVTDWEKKIAQFKVNHLGELPEQMEMNMRSLERISVELRSKSDERSAIETRRSELVRARQPADSEVGRLAAAEDAMSQQLISARTAWTADHPEVQRLTKELTAVKRQREQAEGKLWAEKQERARAAGLLARIENEIAHLQKQGQDYQARLERGPRWAHDLGVMQRDYEIAKTKYQSLVGRKVEAEVAQELEAKNGKALFNVISPAFVPTTPAKPDRPTAFMLAFVISLGLGVLAAVILELRDDSVRDLRQIKERLPLPVLAVVPQMNGKAARRMLLPANDRTSIPASLN